MLRSNKMLVTAFALVSAALLAAACGSDPTVAPTSAPTAVPTVAPTAIAATPIPTEPPPTATRRPPPEVSLSTSTPVPPAATSTPEPTAAPTPVPTPDLEALSGQAPPHIFIGTATIDGALAPDGTVVTALIDGAEVASSVVTGGDGKYPALQVPVAGQEVTFKIGDLMASQTATTYTGGADVVDLTASS